MDWIIMFVAICAQESNFDKSAYNAKENAAGIVQIKPCVIEDCNKFLKRNYKLDDRKSVFKSFLIMKDYCSLWCKRQNLPLTYENCARIWNGGPSGYKKKSTLKYWEKVKFFVEFYEATFRVAIEIDKGLKSSGKYKE